MANVGVTLQGINRHGMNGELIWPQADRVDDMSLAANTASTIAVPGSALALHIMADTGIYLNYLGSAAVVPIQNTSIGVASIVVGIQGRALLVTPGESLSLISPSASRVTFEWYR